MFLPERIGPYTVLGEIGRGGCGVIYLGADAQGEKVALKTSFPELLGPRFHRECRILTELNHPNIVRVRGVLQDRLQSWLVMDYVQGVPVGKVLLEKRELSALEIVLAATALSDALSHAHHAGVIHRDVSPSNVMLTRDGTPMLLDFGVAKAREDTMITRQGDILGTPGYIAPEVLRGTPAGPAADQFGLGRVLFELACDPKKPQATPKGALGVLTSSLDNDFSRLRKGPEFARLEPVLERMLAPQIEDRYPTMRAVRTAWHMMLSRPSIVLDDTPTTDIDPEVMDVDPEEWASNAETEISIR